VNLQVTRRLLAGLSIVALAVGCSGASNSLSPTGPTAVRASNSAAAVNFSPNPSEPVCPEGQVLNPDTGLCEIPPPPPPPGVGCSPGYWKNHPDDFADACGPAAALVADDGFASCDDLYTAVTCKGSNASCGRSAAAALLNEVSGCTED
jgi:hypothetical protein